MSNAARIAPIWGNKEINKSFQSASFLVLKLMLWEMGHYDREASKRAFKLNWRWMLK